MILLEADDWLGGATALSEGMIWAPNNREAAALTDAPDPEAESEASVAYLVANAVNRVDVDRLRAYVDAAPKMLDFVARAAGLKFALNRASRDYYPDAPGATLGRRALNPVPFDARGMEKAQFARIRPPLGTMMLFGGLSIASRDLADYTSFTRSPGAALRVAGHVVRFLTDRLRGWSRGTRLANGNAIVARLADAVVRSGGDIRRSWPVAQILYDGERATGVSGPRGHFGARLGVILASGGLNASHTARRAVLGVGPHVAIPADAQVPPLAAVTEGTGAQIVTSVLQPVLWAPSSVVPQGLTRAGAWPHFSDRAKPGVICLSPDGKRFTNEAQVYHDFVPAMIAATGNHPEGPHCWIVTDHTAIRRYGLGPVGPSPVRLGPYIRAGYLRRGQTPADLARATGLPAEAVTASLARFNAAARLGLDRDFERGDSVYDRGNGDPAHEPNPTLGPLEQGPFYAIRMTPGDIGTFIGVATDGAARVLDAQGRVVPGLWAAGNAATPITGGSYPAAGLTIGSAMTFGYLAACDASVGLQAKSSA